MLSMTKKNKKAARLERLEVLHMIMRKHKSIFKKEKIQFDINVWRSGFCDIDTGCGYAACALGSAAIYPAFNELGLHARSYGMGGWEIEYKEFQGFDAGAVFFGITQAESFYLFSPDWYSGAMDDEFMVGEITTALTTTATPKSLYLTHKGEVSAKDVANRVSVLIQHYTTTNKPLFKGRYDYA